MHGGTVTIVVTGELMAGNYVQRFSLHSGPGYPVTEQMRTAFDHNYVVITDKDRQDPHKYHLSQSIILGTYVLAYT
jgi:hypothetical protein